MDGQQVRGTEYNGANVHDDRYRMFLVIQCQICSASSEKQYPRFYCRSRPSLFYFRCEFLGGRVGWFVGCSALVWFLFLSLGSLLSILVLVAAGVWRIWGRWWLNRPVVLETLCVVFGQPCCVLFPDDAQDPVRITVSDREWLVPEICWKGSGRGERQRLRVEFT